MLILTLCILSMLLQQNNQRNSHLPSKPVKCLDSNILTMVEKVTEKIKQNQGSLFRNSINGAFGVLNSQRKMDNCK